MPLYDQVELLCQAITSQAKGEVETDPGPGPGRSGSPPERGRGPPPGGAGQDQSGGGGPGQTLDARSRIDRAELEGKRRVSQTKETFLTEVFSQAQARLQAFRETAGYRDWLRATLLGALQQLEGEQFRVMANPEEEKWLTPDLLEEVSQARGCHLDLGRRPGPAPGRLRGSPGRRPGARRSDFSGHHRPPAGNLAGRDRPAAVGELNGKSRANGIIV